MGSHGTLAAFREMGFQGWELTGQEEAGSALLKLLTSCLLGKAGCRRPKLAGTLNPKP